MGSWGSGLQQKNEELKRTDAQERPPFANTATVGHPGRFLGAKGRPPAQMPKRERVYRNPTGTFSRVNDA
mgnify:CR=1 FL=1